MSKASTSDIEIMVAKDANRMFLEGMHLVGEFVGIEYARKGARHEVRGRSDARQVIYHRGKPYGVMVAVEADDEKLQFGWSLIHPKLDKVFHKPIGLYLALDRANSGRDPAKAPKRIKKAFGRFMTEMTLRFNEVCNDRAVKGLIEVEQEQG